jgi:hypothetical protein
MTRAEENVIRRAALVASWLPNVYATTSVGAARELDNLRRAVQRLDDERDAAGLGNATTVGTDHTWVSVGTDDDGTHLCKHGNPAPEQRYGCQTCS